ncbi:MAG TPA: hypothetical protein VIK21_07295 [Desulfuromonadaceae bacterium]
MKFITKSSVLTSGLLGALTVLLFASSAFAADALRIHPTKFDCGVVEEGVPATMLATVENISAKEVHIINIRTN